MKEGLNGSQDALCAATGDHHPDDVPKSVDLKPGEAIPFAVNQSVGGGVLGGDQLLATPEGLAKAGFEILLVGPLAPNPGSHDARPFNQRRGAPPAAAPLQPNQAPGETGPQGSEFSVREAPPVPGFQGLDGGIADR